MKASKMPWKKDLKPEVVPLDFPNCIAREFPDVFPVAWSTVETLENVVSNLDTSSLERHSPGLQGYDWNMYLRCSVARIVRVLRALLRHTPQSARVLDFGAYFGNFSIACRQFGYRVDAADFYTSNAKTFAGALKELQKRDIGIWDFDEVGSDLRIASDETYDAVLCMGVIEHVPNTPRLLFETINRLLKPGGVLILDTPNLAYIYKREQLMRGESVFPPIAHQFHAEIPFAGHHREYTQSEVEWMLRRMGHDIVSLETFSYSIYSIEYLQDHDLENFRIMEKDPGCRELILSVSRK